MSPVSDKRWSEAESEKGRRLDTWQFSKLHRRSHSLIVFDDNPSRLRASVTFDPPTPGIIRREDSASDFADELCKDH